MRDYVIIGAALIVLATIGCANHAAHRFRESTPDPKSSIIYEDLFKGGLQSKSYSIKYACVTTLARSDEKVEEFLSRKLKWGSEKERDFSAMILFIRDTPTSKETVSPYYVEKLKDPKYQYRGISGDVEYRVSEIFSMKCDPQGFPLRPYIYARHVFPIIQQIGKPALPLLVSVLHDRDIEVRMNAYVLINRICGLTIPFDVGSGRDGGVLELLEKTGWLKASWASPGSHINGSDRDKKLPDTGK